MSAADAPASLHRRITAHVAGRITSGDWPPGRRIPFEHELMAAYACSRMTVSKALGELARAGLIERRRRSGSFVAQPRAQAAVLEIADTRQEVEALGLRYRFELLGQAERAATAAERQALGLRARGRVVALQGRHWAGAKPFCLENRAISLDAVPDAAGLDWTQTAPGAWLLSRVPWSAAEHRIFAAGAEAFAATILGTTLGAPCLVVERRTWASETGARGTGTDAAERGVTLVRFTYRAESHALVARFTPAQR